LASTSIVLALGILNFAQSVTDLVTRVNYFGSKNLDLLTVKIILLFLCMISSFFNFSICIRYLNHSTFLMMLPKEERDFSLHRGGPPMTVTHEIAAKVLNRGYLHYTLGMRGYYVLLPLICWLFGPIPLIICTVFLIVVLFLLDHVRINSPFSLHFGKKKNKNKDQTGSSATPVTPAEATSSIELKTTESSKTASSADTLTKRT